MNFGIVLQPYYTCGKRREGAAEYRTRSLFGLERFITCCNAVYCSLLHCNLQNMTFLAKITIKLNEAAGFPWPTARQ